MTKHIVCLTFDFDGISGFIARGSSTPTPVSRGEFGPRVGAPRLPPKNRNREFVADTSKTPVWPVAGAAPNDRRTAVNRLMRFPAPICRFQRLPPPYP